MANTKGTQYRFQIDDLELPFAPSSLTVKINNKNETLTLINEGEVNIPKLPGLNEISFTARIPQTQYPFATNLKSAAVYTDKFKALKLSKKNFKLTISRPQIAKRNANGYGSSVFTVTLEDYTIKEDAEEGLDLLIDLNFKEYVPYSTKVYKKVQKPDTDGEKTELKPATKTDPKPASDNKTYTVVKGDNLWKIARKFYGGTGSNWKIIYDANKDIIESTAKKYGKKSSSNGWWIYPGTKFTIPAKK